MFKFLCTMFLLVTFPACKSVEKRHQEIKIHVITRNVDLSEANKKPGTAEYGCTYSMKW